MRKACRVDVRAPVSTLHLMRLIPSPGRLTHSRQPSTPRSCLTGTLQSFRDHVGANECSLDERSMPAQNGVLATQTSYEMMMRIILIMLNKITHLGQMCRIAQASIDSFTGSPCSYRQLLHPTPGS